MRSVKLLHASQHKIGDSEMFKILFVLVAAIIFGFYAWSVASSVESHLGNRTAQLATI